MVPPYSPRRRLSNASSGGAASNYSSGVYPFPARLRFCPGGITYSNAGGGDGDAELISVHASCDKPAVLAAAKQADDRLRQYSLLYYGKAAAEAAATRMLLLLPSVPNKLFPERPTSCPVFPFWPRRCLGV